MTTVVALGGNALVGEGERGTSDELRAHLRATCAALAALADERLVVTHGNGPQVGADLLRAERAADEAPPLPFHVAVAQTQAEIGAVLAAELPPPAACLVSHVVVDAGDPAFDRPTKPVGPAYAEGKARRLAAERGWSVRDDPGHGWRRVVPSPAPLELVELEAVRALLAAGQRVVACGGGGIPVVRRDGRIEGVDAVIDKDRSSALLAVRLEASRLVILTGVPAVFRDFGAPGQEELRELSPAAVEALLPELPEGSMRPKLASALAYARATGGEALVTSAERLADALAGRAGTRIAAS